MTAALGLLVALSIPLDGVALTPHYEARAEGLTFDSLVDSAAAAGAPNLSVVVQWAQRDVHATDIAPDPVHTQNDEVVRRMIRRARARGMGVMLFPILWVERRGPGAWRGTLAPLDRSAWWASYSSFILHYARMAAEERVRVFSVGSELASMERDDGRWRALIGQVRAVFPGPLLYSANWDHYARTPFWDALDLVGITGYYRLADPGNHEPTLADMQARWALIREHLELWLERAGKRLVITELGYASLDGVASHPWDYTAGQQVDLEEQRLCFEAFASAWRGAESLAGVFFWNWWGPGGPTDTWYTPRGKPAEAVLRAWFAARRAGN
ncbi:MAG: hypothetical protein H6702_13340 [Myxococcales bacterium]|nr:hypothetical protein [Myxococcales bacterium]